MFSLFRIFANSSRVPIMKLHVFLILLILHHVHSTKIIKSKMNIMTSIQRQRKEEKELLSKLVSLTADLTTWKTIGTALPYDHIETDEYEIPLESSSSDGDFLYDEDDEDSESMASTDTDFNINYDDENNQTVLIGYKNIKNQPSAKRKPRNQKTYVNAVKELRGMYKTMNSRMFDIQCTYAYYAGKHLEIIFKIKEELKAYKNDFGDNFIEVISAYQDVALKTLATIHNMGYQPHEWMLNFSRLVNKKYISLSTFIGKLTAMLIVLRRFTNRYTCKPRYLLSIVPRVSKEKLEMKKNPASWTDKDQPWEVFQYKNYVLKTKDQDQWFEEYETNFQTKKKQLIDSASWLSPKLKRSVYSCREKAYIFKILQNLSIAVNKNVSEISYLLHINVLTYYNFKDVDFSQHKLFRMTRKQYDYEKRYSMRNQISFYKDEVERTKKLHVEVYSMIDVQLWRSVRVHEAEIFNCGFNNSEISSFRCESGILAKTLDWIMRNVECTYAHYAWKHLDNAQNIIQTFDITHDGCSDQIVQLVYKYYEVSLKTIATIFNKGYRAPKWMVEIIFYLRNVLTFTAGNCTLLKAENAKMMFVVKDIVDSCPQLLEPNFQAHKEKILDTFKGHKNTAQSIKYITRLELTLYRFQGISKESHALKINENVLHIIYVLEFNKNQLSYRNHHKFDPSSWLLSERDFNANEVVDKLRWDTIEDGVNDKIWENVKKRLSDNLRSYKNENDPIIRIRLSVVVHNSIFNITQATMMRYILSLSAYCRDLWGLTNSLADQPQNMSADHSTSSEYAELCSENSNKSIINFIELTKPVAHKIFIALLHTESITPNMFKEKFRMGVKKFNDLVVTMKLNSDVPVRPIWTQRPTAELLKMSRKINKSFQMYSNWIIDIKTKVDNLILGFKKIFKKIDFSTYNLLAGSFNSSSICSIYIE